MLFLFKFLRGRALAGEILKKRREESGFSVEGIAEALKIRKDYLSAIEEDAFEKLPVPVYTLGYIRAYAKYLNVDSDPIVAFYNKHLSQPESATIMPIAFSRKKGPGIYIVVALFVIVAGGIGLFFFLNHGSESRTAPKVNSQPPVQRQTGPIAAHESAPLVMPPETKKHSLKIIAEETTWLSLKFSNGQTEETLLRPGDSKTWSFSGEATIKIGNAGGIDIIFDDNDLGTPGNSGEIISLTLPEEKGEETTSP
jgi:cytoskeletal protein RodZ